MSVIDRRRLDPSVFGVDARLRDGRFTDRYFLNVRDILGRLAAEGYRFRGASPEVAAAGADPSRVAVGDLVAEMQVFTKREPFAVACGTDHAVAILKAATGCRDAAGHFQNTARHLEVEAVHDGAKLEPWAPAMKIRGRYRDFAALETVLLGVLGHSTRIATRAYELLQAAAGKPVFFFPARFGLPSSQPADGYAYKTAVDAFNHDTGRRTTRPGRRW